MGHRLAVGDAGNAARVGSEIVSKIKGWLRFTDDERRSLVDAALAMGRKLMRARALDTRQNSFDYLAPTSYNSRRRRLRPEQTTDDRRQMTEGRRRCRLSSVVCRLSPGERSAR